MLKRPKNESEKQRREAIGLIRASRFVRQYARSHRKISIETIRNTHYQIFYDNWPEIAGEYRIENLKIKNSKHLPPHYSEVPGLMNKSDKKFLQKLKSLEGCEGILREFKSSEEELSDCIEKVVSVAAWIHHLVTHVHPFREGNCRTARLSANLVLERFGLMGISPKIETENKKRYCNALAQIDTANDYEPLKKLIGEGLTDRYRGLKVKYYETKT